MERSNEMRRKTRKQQPKLSSDSLLKTSKKKDIELTEKELGKISGGTPKTSTTGFLKLGGIRGESQDSRFKDWIT
jgi:hypothetical protein